MKFRFLWQSSIIIKKNKNYHELLKIHSLIFFVFKEKIGGQRKWLVEIMQWTHKRKNWYEIDMRYDKKNTKVTVR